MHIVITPQQMGNTEVNTINARELHAHLGVKKQFTQWIEPKLSDAMLDEGIDYLLLNQEVKNPNGGRPSVNYILTLDTAKHIAMMSRTAKGKEVRAYFVEVEKESREGKADQSLEFAAAKSLEAMAEGITVIAQ